MAEIFLSYSSQDRERVRPLVEALEREGWSVWWDRSILTGQDWGGVIEEELGRAKCVVVVWSEYSIKSEWVFREAEKGRARGVLFPAMIDHVKPPFIFSRVQAVRLMAWRGDSSYPELRTLVKSLEEAIGRPSNKSQATPPIVALPVQQIKPSSPEPEKRVEKPHQNYTESLPGRVKLEMVAIPGGSFMMGSKTYKASQPIHKVTLRPFYMGKYQVTQAQWKAVMGNNPSEFKGDDLPVEQVTWSSVEEFCKKLSEMMGKEYRPPSEAEWEYAARAGSTGDYCFGNDESLLDEYGWYDKNSGGRTHPVGQKKPNAWGLYDVHGNVWELNADGIHENYEGAPTDGSAWMRGESQGLRPLRGGSWFNNQDYARAVYRYDDFAYLRFISIGFRVVSVVSPYLRFF